MSLSSQYVATQGSFNERKVSANSHSAFEHPAFNMSSKAQCSLHTIHLPTIPWQVGPTKIASVSIELEGSAAAADCASSLTYNSTATQIRLTDDTDSQSKDFVVVGNTIVILQTLLVCKELSKSSHNLCSICKICTSG